MSIDQNTEGRCARCGRAVPRQWIARSMPGVTTSFFHAEGDLTKAEAEGERNLLGSEESLGHFLVLNRLGAGGMGTVYYALDKSLQRYVAVKVLRRDAVGPRERNAILSEARAQARFNHPNIVTVYYVATGDQIPFFAMEYVDGPSLQERLKSGAITFDQVVRLALDLVKALGHTAMLGFIHGDIKPANILMTARSSVKLSDFGLAQLSDAASKSVGGTPTYMSPEVLRGEAVSLSSDMYSLGATLYEATFGHVPVAWGRCTDMRALLQAKEQEVEFPASRSHHLPDAWIDVLSSLLAQQPKHRPSDYPKLIERFLDLTPSSPPNAGWIPRFLAWCVDNTLLFALLAFPVFVAATITGMTIEQFSDVHPIAGVLLALVVVPVPLVGHFVQAEWGTSPGKRLFHCRIVDEYGLQPGRGRLTLRAAFQFLPIWSLAAVTVVGNLRLVGLIPIVGFVSGLVLVVDCLACIGPGAPRWRTLHDRLTRTRVVVDTSPR